MEEGRGAEAVGKQGRFGRDLRPAFMVGKGLQHGAQGRDIGGGGGADGDHVRCPAGMPCPVALPSPLVGEGEGGGAWVRAP